VSALWLAPLGVAALMAVWCLIQQAWLRAMQRPQREDALARPGCAGCDCGTVPSTNSEQEPPP
jgi:hypothetical protein